MSQPAIEARDLSADLRELDFYIREWLPARLLDSDHALLREVGVPSAIRVKDADGGELAWTLLEMGTELRIVDSEPVCSFTMSTEVFRAIAAGRLTPQRAFYTFKLRISGNMLTALKLGGILESIFKRIPADWPLKREATRIINMTPHAAAETMPASGDSSENPHAEIDAPGELTERQKFILSLHFDEYVGTPYWVEKSRALNISADDLYTYDDLKAFGPMSREEQETRPWRDFVPKAVLDSESRFILGETGGATGAPITAAWSKADFTEAFITPLKNELEKRRIAGLRQWLFVGPSGPHIIGKAARGLARETTGCDPLEIDFDPRWHRRLASGGAASRRHLKHLEEQTVRLLHREQPDVLFITPSVLRGLIENNSGPWRDELRVVHLGGQSMSHEERAWLVERLPQECALINGYGNSLFGCLLEDDADQPLTYPAGMGDRLRVELVEDDGQTRIREVGKAGAILFHRFDRSRLILNQLERDTAEWRPDGRISAPRPRRLAKTISTGIY